MVLVDEVMVDFKFMDFNFNIDCIGVIWGLGIGGLKIFQDECEIFFKGDGIFKMNFFFILKMIVDIVVGYIFIKYGLCGLNYVIVFVCVFFINVIIDVFNLICFGKVDVIVIGGLEVVVNEMGVGGFNVFRVLFICNDFL